MMNEPSLSWDWGTAYDLFVSLHVLHEPTKYGLRPSWAAGVRSRLPAPDREFLEQAQTVASLPLRWINTLPAPKDGTTVLWVLGQVHPGGRLLTLIEGNDLPEAVIDILRDVINRRRWNSKDQEVLRDAYQEKKMPPRPKSLTTMLDLCSRPDEFGERYLSALRTYQHVFFTEEEKNIRPALEEAVNRSKELAAQLPFDALVEKLSRGVRLEMELEFNEWVLVPSYWVSPLVVFNRLSKGRGICLFGGRPLDVSLVPGDVIPEGMLRALKTLGDPTRLRILRYLSHEAITPAELSRRLRLRAPTVTHHLNALRLAGLVYLTLEEKHERRYAARLDAIAEMFATLQNFLSENAEETIEA